MKQIRALRPKQTIWSYLWKTVSWIIFIYIVYQYFSKHNIQLHISDAPTNISTSSPNGLEIRKAPDASSYVTHGTINDVPVTFTIDTGATTVSVSQVIAQQAGIRCEQQRPSVTANGTVMMCAGHADSLTFGPFRITNILVSVMPNGENALLGLNALRHFTTTTSGNVLRISTQGQTTFAEEEPEETESEAQPTFIAPQMPESTPAVAGEQSPSTSYPAHQKKSLKECMGTSNTIDDNVLACMNGR